MAVPKRRTSSSRQGMRRSHHGLKPKGHSYCDRCGDPTKPHILCAKCGWSNVQKRELVNMEAKTEE